MKSIGGYFELELPQTRHKLFEEEAVYLNSGRNALEYILLSLGHIEKVYIPYYTCDVVLEPFIKHKIPYAFYAINEQLEVRDTIQLNENEYIIVNNYFGIKDAYMQKMFEQYGNRIIIDNAQAMYAPHIEGTKAFYSPRKYVGIPDGGVAYTLHQPDIELPQDYSNGRVSHLLKRIDIDAQSGYADFKTNSKKLSMQPIMQMSVLTKRLLTSIDFEGIKKRRLHNFAILREALDDTNELYIPHSTEFECPMVYPYMTTNVGLREHLIKNNIFVAAYWPNVKEWAKVDNSQARLAEQIIPIPCDQRYDETDMKRIIIIMKKRIANAHVSDNSQILLGGGGVKIRPLQIDDAKTSYKWRNDREVFKYTGNTYSNYISYETELEWIKRVIQRKEDYRCAILVGDTYVGNIYLTDIDGEKARYHIFIGERTYWGKGVAQQASRLILRYAFEVLNLSKVTLTVKKQNIRAMHLYQKLGFECEEEDIEKIFMVKRNI